MNQEKKAIRAAEALEHCQANGKVCSRCKIHKSYSDFSLDRNSSVGISPSCIECNRAKWHARKPPAIIEPHQYPAGFSLSESNVRDIMTMGDDGKLRWKVESARTRKGDIVGEKSGCRQKPRVLINGVRYRVDDIVALWNDGEIPVRIKVAPRNVVYEAEWMNEIKSHRVGFDWGCVWDKEKSRRNAKENWNNLTTSQKASREQSKCKLKKRAYLKEWKRNARMNPVFRMRAALSSRLSQVIRNSANPRSKSTMTIVGCDTRTLRNYIEALFKKGMTWDNYGTHWHVDHIIPVSSFDHSIPSQVKQCWHWTNLQPLDAATNMSKGSKITHPQMSLCM